QRWAGRLDHRRLKLTRPPSYSAAPDGPRERAGPCELWVRTRVASINPERLLADLRRLRKFGAQGAGVVRLALSSIDVESRHWLAQCMSEAGLDAAIDGVGTVFGRSRKPGPALVIGSHSDTQPSGGWLDGAMGVIYGLEVARTFAETEDDRNLAVDVASWMDE